MARPLSFISWSRFFILSFMIPWGLVFALQEIARGEERKPGKMVLNLSQLIEMAIAQSPEIGGIQSEIAAAKSDLDQVKGAYFPQLQSTAITGPVQDAKEPEVRNGRITDPSPALSTSSIGIFGRLDLTATQPLYTFGKLSHREEAAKRGVKAKESQLDQKKGQIVLRVKELYYALILAGAGVESANESESFFKEAGRRIQRLLDLNSSNVRESDQYRVDAYQADTLRFRAEAEKGVKVAYFALKSMIRLPPGVEFEPAEKTLTMKRGSLADLASYIREATEKRPEFKQLAEALAAQDSQVKAATADRYPSFFAALHGSLAGAPGRESLYNSYFPDPFNHAWAGAVAGIKWDFDFGIARAKVDKSRAEYDKLIQSKAFAEMNIPIQVAKSYQENQEWEVAVNSYQKAATASRKWVFSSMADFDMGVGTAYDMLNAIDRYGHNQGRYLEALLHYSLSLAELEYSAGMKTW